jgi:hypothetical protein
MEWNKQKKKKKRKDKSQEKSPQTIFAYFFSLTMWVAPAVEKVTVNKTLTERPRKWKDCSFHIC